MPTVFISHATADRDVVTRDVIDLLRDHGIDVWFAEDDIATARPWQRSILEGLQACDWFLVALTPRAVESEWVKDEVHWAIEERPERIVPVLLEDCDARAIHIRLPRIQHVDFRAPSDDARARLLACWGLEYRPAGRSHLRSYKLGDRYSITEPLPSRDFPREFLGRDKVLRRAVWIKSDACHSDGDGHRRHPIATEALATASFVHPAIPRVFDLARDDELGVYSVLEHVPGQALRDYLKAEPVMPAGDAIELVASLADAVDYANQRGVIHRNIKPGSVIIGQDLRPVLTNFIVAKLWDQPEIPGAVCGTVNYMAPEQAEGASDLDSRADVWGLGVLLYELLTGKLPFHRENLTQGAADILRSLRSEPARPPREHVPSIPPGLEDVCLRCLEKDRTRRYPTASCLAEALNGQRGRKGP